MQSCKCRSVQLQLPLPLLTHALQQQYKTMRASESQEWQKNSPLLYSFLASVPAPNFASLSKVAIAKQPDNSYFKFEEYRAIVAGHSQARNGLLTINTLLMPQARELDDDRIKPVLNQICQLNFESEVTHFDQCIRKESQSLSSSFLIVVEQKNPSIYVYESIMLERCKEKATVNPRMVLGGHDSEVTALRCRRNDILSGSKNGEVRMHNLNHGETPVTYKYHLTQINDCCWLSNSEETFISISADGFIFAWDKRTTLPSFKMESKQGELLCLESLKDNYFLTGGKDGTVKLYDVRSGSNKAYAYKEHTAPVTFLKKLEGKEGDDIPHQILFASGSSNGEVLLCGEQVEFAHLAHSSEIRCICYDHSSDMLTTVQKKSAALCVWKPVIFQYQ